MCKVKPYLIPSVVDSARNEAIDCWEDEIRETLEAPTSNPSLARA